MYYLSLESASIINFKLNSTNILKMAHQFRNLFISNYFLFFFIKFSFFIKKLKQLRQIFIYF